MLADVLFDKLLNKISIYNPNFDSEFVTRAYKFAAKAHEGQFRKSGEPYIVHPIYTAINLTRIRADETSIVAALLHDVPEDTERGIADIEDNFGADVAGIVEGVTKLSKVYYKFDMREREIDSLRKLFVSISKDIRVILVKICDRLHNLYTLHYLREDKRMRIAKETLEVYVPIVNLLSIGEFMGEMEDLCFKNLYVNEYKQLYENFGKKYDYFRKKIESIKETLLNEFNTYGIKGEVLGRIKSLFSIYNKMTNKNVSWDMIYDVLALRVVTDSVIDCYKILGIIHGQFKVKEDKFKDYISSPKNNGYQSIHTTVFDFDGNLVEFQILTQEMHTLNKYGLASHYVYKKYHQDYFKVPSWIKDVLEIQKGSSNTEHFYDTIKTEILSPNIQCFTPKGDMIDLPESSTVLDFAYKVHTDLGNYFLGAYINGNYTDDPMYTVKKGDVVNIIKSTVLNNDFLIEYISIVKTNVARENLKRFFRGKSDDNRIKLGKYILNKRLEIFGLRHFDDLPFKIKDELLQKFNAKPLSKFYDYIGSGNIEVDSIIRILSTIYKKKDNYNEKNVELKINTKLKDYTTLSGIIDLFKLMNVKIKNIKYEGESVYLSFYVSNFYEFQKIFGELKRLPNIRDIKRLFPFSLVIFNIFLLLFMFLVVINPFILSVILKIEFIESNIIIGNLVFMLTFLVMFGLIYMFSRLVRITLPDVFNKKIFWVYMFILNTIVFGTIAWEMMFIKTYLNGLMFLGLAIAIYGLLSFEYLQAKKEDRTA